jgi:hypothetical protein
LTWGNANAIVVIRPILVLVERYLPDCIALEARHDGRRASSVHAAAQSRSLKIGARAPIP